MAGKSAGADEALLHMQIEHDMRNAEHSFVRQLSHELKKNGLGSEISGRIIQWLNPSEHNPNFLAKSGIFLREDAGGSDEARRTVKKLGAIKDMLHEFGIEMETGIRGEEDVPIIELRILQEKSEVIDCIVRSALSEGAIEPHAEDGGEEEHEEVHAISRHDFHGEMQKQNAHNESKKGKAGTAERKDIEKKVESILQKMSAPEEEKIPQPGFGEKDFSYFGSAAKAVLESTAHFEKQEDAQGGIVQEKTGIGEVRSFILKPKSESESPAFEFAKKTAAKITPHVKMMGGKHEVDASLVFPQEEIRRWISEMVQNAQKGGYTTFNSGCDEKMVGFYKEAAREIMAEFLEKGIEMEIKFAKEKDGRLAAKTEFALPISKIEKLLAKNEEAKNS